MNPKIKQYAFIAAATALLVVLIYPWKKKPKKIGMPTPADPQMMASIKDAQTALSAYGDAVAAGEGPDGLARVNAMLQQKYNLRVRHQGNKFVATDLKGKVVQIMTQ